MSSNGKQLLTPVELRKRANLTQRRASDIIGVREGTISEWERGISAPNILLVPKIMEAYACTEKEVIEAFLNAQAQAQRNKTN